MGEAGKSLIRNIDVQDILTKLDSFYSHEMIVMHFCYTLENRLEGQAPILIGQEVRDKAKESLDHAKKLAERIAQLGGSVTGDPRRFVELSPLKRFDLPSSISDVGTILSYILDQERGTIKFYGDFLQQVKDKDDLTYKIILEILEAEVRREAEIQSVLLKG